MSGVFVSYRRDDAAPYAGRIGDRLAEHFGADRVFRDVDTLMPGVDFARAIDDALGRCDALLALIGGRWLTAARDGRRRLDDPDDYVRREIAAALARDVRVVPVLLEDTRLPGRQELPADLARLAERQALHLTDRSWGDGMRRLIAALEPVVGPPERGPGAAGDHPPPAGGRSIVAHIEGSVGGQVAVGHDIRQHQAVPAAAGGTTAPADPARGLARLRRRVGAAAPEALAVPALERIDELEEALREQPPDAVTLDYVRQWFADNLPACAVLVAEVAARPAGGPQAPPHPGRR